MPRRRRSDVAHTGQDAKLVAISFTSLRDAKPPAVQRARAREGRMREVRTGGAHDYYKKVDCPSPSAVRQGRRIRIWAPPPNTNLGACISPFSL